MSRPAAPLAVCIALALASSLTAPGAIARAAGAPAPQAQPPGTVGRYDPETGEITWAPRVTPRPSFSRRGTGTTALGDTFVIVNHSWDARSGGCQASGWTVEDRVNKLFGHVSSRHVTNTSPMFMGTQAFWFGADVTSAPDEVRNWYYLEGHGQNWSQRLTSAPVSLAAHAGMTLDFDATVDIAQAANVTSYTKTTSGGTKLFGVQAQLTDSTWAFLETFITPRFGTGFTDTARAVRGSGAFHGQVRFTADGNPTLGLAEPTRLRFIMNTTATFTQEDGQAPIPSNPERGGGVVLDNVVLADLDSTFETLDFEDGGTGAWTPSAQNGIVRPNPSILNVQRENAPSTVPSLRSDLFPESPGCLWTFVGAGDTIPNGAMSRLTSPWVHVFGGGTAFNVDFDARFGLMGEFNRFIVRGKRAGDTHPRLVALEPFIYFGATGYDDSYSQFFQQIEPYPGSFTQQTPLLGTPVDSVQLVIEFSDQPERMPPFGLLPGHGPTQLPYFSRVSFTQTGVDPDGDGVATDTCSADATGRDADANGCPDSSATLRHVESWARADGPIHWAMSERGLPAITDGSDTTAVRDGFAAWANVTGSALALVEDPATPQTHAMPLDGVNLVTFEDSFAFPPNVLAITPTTSFTRNTSFFDVGVLPGQIVDADVIFNPNSSFRTATSPSGAFDIQSVATHEIGHLLGLSHSTVLRSTMFPVLQPGEAAASLEPDDEAALVAAYPPPVADPGFGAVGGHVLSVRENHVTTDPVPGAAVFAVRLDGLGAPVDTAASDYTDEAGTFGLFHLPPGNYAVRILPLDGTIEGAVPEAINARVASIARTNFPPEWYGGPESFEDDPDAIAPVAVTGGTTTSGIDIITNIDVTPPTVASASPGPSGQDIPIDTAVLVTFSEPVADTTVAKAFKLRLNGNGGTLGGRGQLLPPGTSFVFTPTNALEFGQAYELQLTTSLTDRAGVPLGATFSDVFTTELRPNIAITDVAPREAIPGALLTLSGVGFTPGGYNVALFTVGAGTADSIPGTQVTPTSLVVRIPDNAVTGPVHVIGTAFEVSNGFNVTVLTPVPASAPAPSGDAISVGFPPTDVAVSPEGTSVFAVGDTGYVTISLCACRPPFRAAVFHALRRGHHLALSPDGRRLFITRPDSADVVEVVADTSSGQFGQVVARIAIPGTPDGIVAAPGGRRVYVSDVLLDQIHEIDMDPASVTFRHVVGRRTVPLAVFTGGLAMDPQAERLLATTRNYGLIAVDLAQDNTWTVLSDQATSDAVAATPGGTEVLACPSGDVGSPPLVFAPLPGGAGAGSLSLGGTVRDLVIDARGQSAFIVNESFSRLQVIGLGAPADPNHHRTIAEAALGANPVAIARSGDGGLLAVANFGESSISVLHIGGAVSLVRATPPVAAPGDAVVLALSGGTVTPGTRADLGEGEFPVIDDANSEPGLSAFVLPATTQQEGHVSLSIPPEQRTLALPFRVVDPIPSFAPRPTGLVATTTRVACPPDSQTVPLERLLASPDGHLLAAFKQAVAPPACGVVIDLVDVTVDAQGRFGRRLASVATPFGVVIDARFTPDGRELWLAIDPSVAAEIRVLDTDPASSSFGQFTSSIPLGALPSDARLAADPAGRWMYLSSSSAGGIARYDLDRTLRDVLPLAGVTALEATPDGRMLVVAQSGVASVFGVKASGLALLGMGPGRAGAIDRLVVPTGGTRVFGRFSGGEVGVWNLAAASGAIGSELSFGSPIPDPLATGDWVPAPDGVGVIAACAECDSLIRLTNAPGGPVAEFADIGEPAPHIARSVDGRLIWAGPLGEQVRAFSLSEAAALSVVTGTGEESPLGTPLPLPVRVQIADATGRPQAGVVVRFAVADTSHGTLGGAAQAMEVFATTDADGESECAWTMPYQVKAVSLDVTALGVPGGALTLGALSTGDDHQTPPVVVELGPTNGATGIASGSPLFARFSKAMNPDSIGLYLLLKTGDNGFATGAVTLEQGGRVAIYRPPVPMVFSSSCTLQVVRRAPDVDGLRLAASSITAFTVQSQPALALTSLSPPAGPPGAAIVIQGEGFSSVAAQNTILLNQTLVPAQSASPTGLVVRIPTNALSGDLVVKVGSATSNALHLSVLPANPQPLKLLETEPARRGIRDLAVMPKKNRAYATNPTSNSVTAFRIVPSKTLAIVPVGLEPQSIALLSDGTRAYVANRGSNDVTVIDIDEDSPTYHKVVATVPVGSRPTDLAVTATGPRVIVACAGDSTVRVIDANPDHSTYNRIVTTLKTGSGGTNIVVSPDGGSAYIATSNGIDVLDLRTNAIVTTIKVGSGGTQVTVSPDGTLLFILTGDGTVAVVDISSGSATQNQIVTTIKVGAGGTTIAVSPDGTMLYISLRDLNLLLGLLIGRGNTSYASSSAPGQAVTLTPSATVEVGQSPAGLAFDPQGTFGLVANQGSGTLQILSTLTPSAGVEFDLDAFDLAAPGDVRAYIQPGSPFTADQVIPTSVRLNDIVGIDPFADSSLVDHNEDTVTECAVPFRRVDLAAVLPIGTGIPVTIAGTVGLLPFTTTVNVNVRRGDVASPMGGEEFVAGQSVPVVYTPLAGTLAHAPAAPGAPATATLLGSPDNGRTWTTQLSGEADDGSIDWTVPGGASVDSFRVAVVEVEEDLGDGKVRGVWSVSAPFRVVDVATATLLADFDVTPADNGVGVSWRLASPSDVRALAIERAESEAGPWTAVTGAPRDSAGLSLLVDTTVDLGRAYFYRLRLTLADGRRVAFGPLSAVAGSAVREFALVPLGASPIRGVARIRFDVAAATRVRLVIYDIAGREVARLADGPFVPGRYTVAWGGAGGANSAPAGVYFVRYRAGGRTLGRTLVIVR